MKHWRTTTCLIFVLGQILSAAPKFEILEEAPPLDEKGLSAALVLLMDNLHKDSVSTDSAWEVFTAFVGEDATKRDKAMIFVNILSNGQAPLTKRTSYEVRPRGPFIRNCSAALSISPEALLGHFATKMADDRHGEQLVQFDARKLFLSFGTKELEDLMEEDLRSLQPNSEINPESNKNAEQAGTEQPATRSQSKSEGDDKPKPESEGRSR